MSIARYNANQTSSSAQSIRYQIWGQISGGDWKTKAVRLRRLVEIGQNCFLLIYQQMEITTPSTIKLEEKKDLNHRGLSQLRAMCRQKMKQHCVRELDLFVTMISRTSQITDDWNATRQTTSRSLSLVYWKVLQAQLHQHLRHLLSQEGAIPTQYPVSTRKRTSGIEWVRRDPSRGPEEIKNPHENENNETVEKPVARPARMVGRVWESCGWQCPRTPRRTREFFS